MTLRKFVCSKCDGLGEWDEGPLPAHSAQIDPEYRQVKCPECNATGRVEIEVPAWVKTNHDHPPIPVRNMDWSAIDDRSYDVDCDQDGFFSTCPVGHGATEEEAIKDLLEQIEE